MIVYQTGQGAVISRNLKIISDIFQGRKFEVPAIGKRFIRPANKAGRD